MILASWSVRTRLTHAWAISVKEETEKNEKRIKAHCIAVSYGKMLRTQAKQYARACSRPAERHEHILSVTCLFNAIEDHTCSICVCVGVYVCVPQCQPPVVLYAHIYVYLARESHADDSNGDGNKQKGLNAYLFIDFVHLNLSQWYQT